MDDRSPRRSVAPHAHPESQAHDARYGAEHNRIGAKARQRQAFSRCTQGRKSAKRHTVRGVGKIGGLIASCQGAVTAGEEESRRENGRRLDPPCRSDALSPTDSCTAPALLLLSPPFISARAPSSQLALHLLSSPFIFSSLSCSSRRSGKPEGPRALAGLARVPVASSLIRHET